MKLSRILCTAACLLLMPFDGISTFAAENVTVNAEEVTVYGMDEWAEPFLTLPADKTSFQLTVSGASDVSYRVKEGSSVTVSKEGLIEPAYITWYWYGGIGYSAPQSGKTPTEVENALKTGDSVVRITADGTFIDVTVHTKEYATDYADQCIDQRISECITDDMSDKDKITEACKYAASFDYSPEYYQWNKMVICGGGDCWASTGLIIRFCKKLGLEAWTRNGNRDLGAGSGHKNAMILTSDGEYYEADAGYAGTAPRQYSVKLRDSLFSFRNDTANNGIQVYQYDGKEVPEHLIVPDTINGKPVTSIGAGFLSYEETVKRVTLPDSVVSIQKNAFNSCTALETINLPASLRQIGELVFTRDTQLREVTVPDDCAFVYENGMLFDREKTTFYASPAAETVILPSTVRTIAPYAFTYSNILRSVTLPAELQTIGEGAFGDCKALTAVKLPETLTALPDFAFTNCTALEAIRIPENVSVIAADAFRGCSKLQTVIIEPWYWFLYAPGVMPSSFLKERMKVPVSRKPTC